VSECQPKADIFYCIPSPARNLVTDPPPKQGWHNIRQAADNKLKKNLFTKNKINMASVNIKPLADRVLVEPAQAETKTASGIIIPDTAKEKPQRGKVVAVGEGKKDEPMTVKVNDMVLYGKYSGTEITVDGQEYLIMRESDIYAII
jgi:chaperonin GroES